MVPDPDDRKLGHALGKRTATQKANVTGSAGNLQDHEESQAAV